MSHVRCAALVLAILLLAPAAQPAWAQTCPDLGWERFIGPGRQKFEQVERIPMEGGRMILALRFEGLDGNYAKRFLFLRFLRRDCVDAAVSLGSYAHRNEFAGREKGGMWHLDHYAPGEHATLGTFDAEQPYEEVKKAALQRLRN